MKKLVHIVDPQPYGTAVSGAMKNLAISLGLERKSISLEDLKNRRIDRDSSAVLFLFEAALVKIAQITIRELRSCYPNARFIGLGSDSIWVLRGGGYFLGEPLLWDPSGPYEFFSPRDCDLFLDTMSEVVAAYRAQGITCDQWLWTTNNDVVEMGLEFLDGDIPPKTHDFIGLFSIDVATDYRKKLWSYLDSCGYQSYKTGSCSYEWADLFIKYSQSWFVLGTTSSSWTSDIRTMKGFRDWIGPCVGTPLIYDDHPDVLNNLPVPTYKYGVFEEIPGLIESINYEVEVERQHDWIVENTIEKQLERRLRQYNLIA